MGACPTGCLRPQARSQVGLERAASLLPCTARAPCSQCACLHSCVCCVFVFLLHVLLLLFLTLPYILVLLCTPQFPSSRHPSSSQELEKPLSGARPLPHPPSQGVCPALPSVLPSVQADGLAAWQAKELKKNGGSQRVYSQPQGPSPHPAPGMLKVGPALCPLSLLEEAPIYPPAPSL